MGQIKIINEVNEVKKKRKVSKKNKKSWRKHIDISDVDNYLEEKRLEERLGGPLENKPDAQLFAIDSEPNNVVKKFKTKAEHRLALKNYKPKCFAILNPSSAVPDPISKRNRVKTLEEKKGPTRKYFETLNKSRGEIKLKDKLIERNKKLAELKRANKYKKGEYNKDIWNDEKSTKDLLDGVDPEWFSEGTIKHTIAVKGKVKHKIPNSISKKPSVLPAVEAPHPGISYNPSYEDHQALLNEIVEKEKKMIKEEKHLDRVTSNMFRKVSSAENEKNQMAEMSEGLEINNQAELNGDNVDDDGNLNLSVNPPVQNKKKTRAQRNKQKRQLELMMELQKKKAEKKQITDIYRLKFLDEQIKKKEEKDKLMKVVREKKKAVKSLEPKILSKNKFEEMDQEFQLGSELSGNLRNAVPSKTLLKDRYKSLQQRNILTPGNLVVKRSKASVKRYIKSDHKINWPVKNNK